MKKSNIISIGAVVFIFALILGYVAFIKPKVGEPVQAPEVNNSKNKVIVSGNLKIKTNKTTVTANGRDSAYIFLELYDDQKDPIANRHIIITSDRGVKDLFYRSVSGSIRLNTDPHGSEFFSVSSKNEGVSKINIKGENINEVNQEITFIKPKSNTLLKIHPDGTLVRFSVYPKIWRIIGDKKHAVPTVNVFDAYGFERNKIVIEYDPKIIDAYSDVDLIKEKGKTKIYQLVNGCLGKNCDALPQKHWIPSTELFTKYEFSWDDIIEVSKEEIDSYPRVSLITVSSSNNIYYLTEEGQKRLIPNPEIFISRGYEWDNILFISEDEFIEYSEGKPLE